MAFSIDPDPASPTLGDMLDRESRGPKRERAAPAIRARDTTVPPQAPRPKDSPLSPRGTLPPLVQGARGAPDGNLSDQRATGSQVENTLPLPPLKPVSAVPHVPRNASTVHVRRAVARPRNAPVLPAIPPLDGDEVVTGSIAEGNEPIAIEVEAVLPPRRPEARLITINPLRSPADAKLLREPQHTHSTPALPVGPTGDAGSFHAPLPPSRPVFVADASSPRTLPLSIEAEAAWPKQPRRSRSRAEQPISPVQETAPSAPPMQQTQNRVVLPPLEEPPRVAPKPRVPDPPPPPPKASAAPQPAPARTSDPATPVEGDRFVYVVDQDLRQFLTDFARRVGLRADVAANVRGRLTRVKLPLEPQPLLRDLEKRFDLEWLIEGEILKVASRSDLATRILPLGPVQYDDLVREMRALDIDVTRYPLKRLTDSNALIITAPAAYVGRVAALIETLRAGKTVGPDLRIVRSGVTRKVEWE